MRLPSFQELSKEQDGVYTMPLDGNHLVSGPPGTGKTVMALYRAQALAIDDRPCKILMHSKVLQQYTSLAAREVDAIGSVQTFHSWMWSFWKRSYGGSPPKVDGDPWAFDWPEITKRFTNKPPAADSLVNLLIDEGQDLSKRFYQLVRMMATNITVFADENQKLYDDNSTLAEIRGALGRQTATHKLTRNYRNTREVAMLAAQFYCGGPTGIPDLPVRTGDVPVLRRLSSLNEFVDLVARYESTYSDRSIGVVSPTKKLQKSLYNRLSSRATKSPVEAYISGNDDHTRMDFSAPGIKIVNMWTAKGLEFDAVFVPELQLVAGDPTSAEVRMRFYVVMSRAREELVLCYTADAETAEPRIVGSIPNELLERV